MVSSLLLSLALGTPPAAPAPPHTAAVIAIEPSAGVLALVAQATAAAGAARVLTGAEVSLRLRAAPPDCTASEGRADDACSRPPDEAALGRLGKDAATLEAHFDSDGAVVLRRQVLAEFERTPAPSARLRELAGQAWQGIASAHFAAGERSAAAAAAREAVAHFGDVPVDPRRFSPQLRRLFADAKARLAKGRSTRVTVRTSEPGKLVVDGSTVASLTQVATVQLPEGHYRLWVVARDGTSSLPYPITCAGSPLTVTVDLALDRRLTLGDVPALACQEDECPALLARLRTRLGVDELTAVRRGPSGETGFYALSPERTAAWITW